MKETCKRQHVYLSPHLDDVVLSCGGQVWLQAQDDAQPLVVTVFAGRPPTDRPLSAFARSLHDRWEHPEDAAAIRQQEDRAALAIVEARWDHWPYTDCIYRQTPDGRFAYDSEESLWSEIHPTEDALIAELMDRITALPRGPAATLYAPLGLGHHVDHCIVRRAAEATHLPIVYYEDFPYAEDPVELEAALEDRNLKPRITSLSEAALQAKIAAVACYRSQISTFWYGLTEMAARVRAFAEQIGGGRPAERYWT